MDSKFIVILSYLSISLNGTYTNFLSKSTCSIVSVQICIICSKYGWHNHLHFPMIGEVFLKKEHHQAYLFKSFKRAWWWEKYLSNDSLIKQTIMETFWFLTKFSFEEKWNEAWLLVINMVYTSCLASCWTTWDLRS